MPPDLRAKSCGPTPAASARSTRACSRRSSRSRRSRSSPSARPTSGARAEYAVSLLESFGGDGQALRDEGPPDRPRPLRPRPEATRRSPSTTTSTCSRPRARTGGPRPSTSPSEGDRYSGRGTTDDKGPAITALFGARYACEQRRARQHPLPLGARGGDRQPALRDDDPRPRERLRDRLGRRLRHGLGVARASRAARRGCAACRASASTCRRARPTSTPARPAARRATR